MKTIKLPYKSNKDITPAIKQFSNIVRYSYNRFLENKNEKDIRALSKQLSSINLLNSWLIQCGILEGKSIQTRFGEQKIVFGGKNNLLKWLKNKISKEEYNNNRLYPLSIQGESLQSGNRSFKLDIIDNNQIIFKLNKKQHFTLILPNLRNNFKKDLFKLQELNEVKQGQCGYTYSVRLTSTHIYISFEEFKDEPVQLITNRHIGIDLNPDSIGISVLDGEQILHTQEFSLKPIFNEIFLSKLSSDSNKMKYYQNKLRFETFEISKAISNLAKQFKCKNVFIEDLSFKGKLVVKKVNRKNKNLWKREIFISNLNKRLNILGVRLRKVNPAYSSFIGNLKYDYTDPVNASLEIARRGFEYHINKNKKKFYPNLLVKHQWKEMATKYKDWKEFFLVVKNLKLKYRVSLNEVNHKFNVFKQNSSHKSRVLNYVFYE
ncbi:MAG: hypothetical protein PHV15_02035 [Thomasclavelia ramosa]|nr:hypothetical protein [Thomasclavelia ramosa]